MQFATFNIWLWGMVLWVIFHMSHDLLTLKHEDMLDAGRWLRKIITIWFLKSTVWSYLNIALRKGAPNWMISKLLLFIWLDPSPGDFLRRQQGLGNKQQKVGHEAWDESVVEEERQRGHLMDGTFGGAENRLCYHLHRWCLFQVFNELLRNQ